MGVGQLSESDAVDALRLPFYSSSHPTGSHGWRNQFDLGNPELVDMATATDPTMNRAMHNMKSRRCPHTSERRPMSGIAAT